MIGMEKARFPSMAPAPANPASFKSDVFFA